jgi:hypothetical protein
VCKFDASYKSLVICGGEKAPSLESRVPLDAEVVGACREAMHHDYVSLQWH